MNEELFEFKPKAETQPKNEIRVTNNKCHQEQAAKKKTALVIVKFKLGINNQYVSKYLLIRIYATLQSEGDLCTQI